LPSRAFTVIGVGGFQPASTSFEMSTRSSSIITVPLRSRSTLTGGVTGVEYTSTNDVPDGDAMIPCSASSGVSSVTSGLSSPTLYRCVKYGSRPVSRPTPVTYTVRVFSSTRITSATFQLPVVTCRLSAPVVRS
jgi:hypothetical protein